MNCRSGKETFPSPQSAWRAVLILDGDKKNSSKRRNRMTWAKGRLEGYRCPMCKLWHVGHTVVGGAE